MALANCIVENPFRILALPVTSTDREIKKQLNKLTAYYEMGKKLVHDTDFSFLPGISRSPEMIADAAARIELPDQKLFYANFWFWPGNSVDELVLEVLQEGGVEKATVLWEKAANSQDLSPKNYSNCKNLALLNLIQATQNHSADPAMLEHALRRYSELFADHSYDEFCSAITLGAVKVDALASQKAFVDELSLRLGLSQTDVDPLVADAFFSGFSSNESLICSYVKSSFTEAPIHRIEKALAVAESRRISAPEDAYDSCIELVNQVEKDVGFLTTVLPANDLNAQTFADRVAKELLRSSTAFYNALYEDDETRRTIDRSTELTKIALRFAIGSAVKSEIAEDLKQLADISSSYSARRFFRQLRSEIDNLPSLDSPTAPEIRGIPGNLAVAITNSSRILGEMSQEFGAENSSFIQASDMLVTYGMALLVVFANKTNDFKTALSAMRRLDSYKMSSEVRARFDKNWGILVSNVAMADANSGGCYIATMAFGSYEAPEVVELRKFRDERLAKSEWGRLFIRFYYAFSPLLVECLKDQKAVNSCIRRFLRILIGAIR